jgi:hypothetical protein
VAVHAVAAAVRSLLRATGTEDGTMHITLTDSHVRYSDDSGGRTIFVFGRELPGRVAPGDELVCNDCAGEVALTGTIADVGTVSGGGLAPDRAKLTVR